MEKEVFVVFVINPFSKEKVVQPDEAEERIRFKDTAVGVQLEEDSSKPLFGPDFLSGPFGTPANPTMVPSFCDSRLVGCTGLTFFFFSFSFFVLFFFLSIWGVSVVSFGLQRRVFIRDNGSPIYPL